MLYDEIKEFGKSYVKKGSEESLALMNGLIFDMDGVLIDVTEAYHVCIVKTCNEYLRMSGVTGDPVSKEFVRAFKEMGGFNSDYDVCKGIIYYFLSAVLSGAEIRDSDLILRRGKEIKDYVSNLADLSKVIGRRYDPSMISRLSEGLKDLKLKARRENGGLNGLKIALGFSKEVEDLTSSVLYDGLIERLYEELHKGEKFREMRGSERMFYRGEGLYLKDRAILKPFFIRKMEEMGLDMLGIATGRYRKEAELGLKVTGLDRYFSEIVSDFEVKNSKPAPDTIKKIIRETGAKGLLAYVGDNIDDVKAAKAAGILSIAVGRYELFKELEPDLIIPDPNYIPFIISKLRQESRNSVIKRKTKETKIEISLTVDGTGESKISTGIGFFDHMLSSFAKHGGFNLKISAKGDLEVEDHHLVEDIGICLGRAFKEATDKYSLSRFGDAMVPMDEAVASVAVDISGRAYSNIDISFDKSEIGGINTENFRHFLDSFARNLGCNIYAVVKGENEHHKVEALFKAFARALSKAVSPGKEGVVLSTKGKL